MYITPSYETSLDPDDAIALNPNEIPLVTFRKRIIYRLGQPYGQCRKRFPSGLTHFKGLSPVRVPELEPQDLRTRIYRTF